MRGADPGKAKGKKRGTYGKTKKERHIEKSETWRCRECVYDVWHLMVENETKSR